MEMADCEALAVAAKTGNGKDGNIGFGKAAKSSTLDVLEPKLMLNSFSMLPHVQAKMFTDGGGGTTASEFSIYSH